MGLAADHAARAGAREITALAKGKAGEWLGAKVEDLAAAGTSWAGAKALMWAIESQLAGRQQGLSMERPRIPRRETGVTGLSARASAIACDFSGESGTFQLANQCLDNGAFARRLFKGESKTGTALTPDAMRVDDGSFAHPLASTAPSS